MDNAEIPATPSVAPVKLDWRPLRTSVPALISIAASAAVGVVLFAVLAYLVPNPDKCVEMIILVCYDLNIVIAATVSIVVAVAIAYVLLRKAKIKHAWVIPSFTYATSLLIGSAINSYTSLSIWLNLSLSLIVLIGLFVLFDWYLNIFKTGWVRKSLAIFFIFIALLSANVYKVDIAGMYKSAGTYALAASLQKSPITILVPPLGSSQLQPHSISANADTSQVYRQDYSQGLYLKINSDSVDAITVYEYSYTGPADPAGDCGNLYVASNQNNGSASQPECQLIATLPSGNKIYSNNSYMGQYFTVKNGTIAYVNKAKSMTEPDIYAFLDQLEPLVVDTFMKTLHEQNPEQY